MTKVINEYKYYKVEVKSKDDLQYIINTLYDIYIDNFIRTLKHTIKHINADINTNITSCITKLNEIPNENDSKENHKSDINFLMNIYTLFSKIKTLLNDGNENYNVIIHNLNEWSLLLRYICSLLYIKKDNYSIIYLNELIEYSSIFDNISKIITKEHLSHSFYMKIYNNDKYVFEVEKEHNLNSYINSNSNDIIINQVFPKIANSINDINLLNIFNNITLYPDDITKLKIIQNICNILIKKYIQPEITIKVYTYKEYFNLELDVHKNIINIVEKLKQKLNDNLFESINIIMIDYDIKEDKKQMLMNVLDNIVHYINRNPIIKIIEIKPIILNYLLTIQNINLYLYLLKKYDNLIINIEFYNLLKFIIDTTINKKSFQSIDFEIKPIEMFYNENNLKTYLYKKGFMVFNYDIANIKYKINEYINELKNISIPSLAQPEPVAPSPAPELEPASAAPVPEHKKIHEIYNMKDVIRLSDDNKNILIIKYGGLGCNPCELMDKPFKLLAEKNTKINYRYCKITYISKIKPEIEELIKKGINVDFDTLLHAGIMQKDPIYPFINIYKDNSLYSIRNYYDNDDISGSDEKIVKYYIDKLNTLLEIDFSNFNGLTVVNLQPAPPPAAPATPQPPAPVAPPAPAPPAPVAPAAPPPPAPVAPVAPPAPAEELLEDIKIVQNISTKSDLRKIMDNDFFVIINFYDTLSTEYNEIVAMNTNNNARFYLIDKNNNDIGGYATFLNITKFPAVAILYKGKIMKKYENYSKSDLITSFDKIDYKYNKVNEILSKNYLTKLMDEYNIVVVKCSPPWCGPCVTFKPIYERIAKENTNRDIIYTALNPEESDLDFFRDEYNITGYPTVIIFNKKEDELRRFPGSKPDEMIEYLTNLSLSTSGGGNNKYKKTDKQITVIYKKKEYTRVIYICERKKYVKINKTFMLLSKLKKV